MTTADHPTRQAFYVAQHRRADALAIAAMGERPNELKPVAEIAFINGAVCLKTGLSWQEAYVVREQRHAWDRARKAIYGQVRAFGMNAAVAA